MSTTIGNDYDHIDIVYNGDTTRHMLKDTQARQDVATKAEYDGYYTDLTAGNAEQLISTVQKTDNTPYTFRTTGGDVDVGNRREIELVGGSIAWNQLVQNGNFESTSGWTTPSGTLAVSNNILTYTPTAFTDSVAFSGNVLGTIQGHKYLARMDAKYNNALPTMNVYIGSGGHQGVMKSVTTLNAWVAIEGIFARETGGNDTIAIYPRTKGMSSGDTINFKNVMCIDLTQMFGSTIADYIYNLEQSETGAGVAWFRNLFPKDYYAYNAGTLMSVNAARAETVGFNMWDEEWVAEGTTQIRSKNQIRFIPNSTYYLKASIACIWYYRPYGDPNEAVKSFNCQPNSTFTTPADVVKATMYTSPGYGNVYKNDICLNLSWSGYRNGEYEPYVKNAYNFDSSLELRGIPKLSADGKLYYDGDIYKSDGSVSRKYGIVDLGTLTWAYNSLNAIFYSNGIASIIQTVSLSKVANAICSRYKTVAGLDYNGGQDKTISIGYIYQSGAINIKDSDYSDTTAFKTAMSGVYLVYELATPTEESAATFAFPQVIDDFGTEEFIDAAVEAETRDVSIPVGHNTAYTANLRDKLQHLPDSTSEDGVYVIKQENKQMELQKFEGHYENVSVDSANQLISSLYEEDKVPYSFRTSGGSADIGDRVKEKIIGGTVAWNQLVNFNDVSSATYNGVTYTNNKNGSFTVSGNTVGYEYGSWHQLIFGTVSGHVYLMTGGKDNVKLWHNAGPSKFSYNSLFKADSADGNFYLKVDSYITFSQAVTVYPQIFDLTQMFGSTIADYVYSLETATAGAGVAWFKALFPNDYYAYNAGELMSVQAARKETTGFNIVDGEFKAGYILNDGTESASNTTKVTKNYLKILPNTVYCYSNALSASGRRIAFYDSNKNFISNVYDSATLPATFTTPSNAAYLRFYTNNDLSDTVCINLSWSGYRNGEYEAYKKNTYALDDSLELRGIPKLDASNKLYWDGDEYASDGSVKRKYGTKTLDASDVESVTTNYTNVTYAVIQVPSDGLQSLAKVGISSKFERPASGSIWPFDTSNGIGKMLANSGNQVYWFGFAPGTTLEQAQTALTGVQILYELATPTDETADPYTNPQIVDDFGTEEFIDAAVEAGDRDVSIPVGHESQYMLNLRDKLQHLPDLASSNGTYALVQNNSQLALTPLITPTELPAAPTTNGTYRLQCVVSNGTPTYSWVSA